MRATRAKKKKGLIGQLEERLQNSALASIIRPEAYVRSSAAESQALAAQREREAARSRTRESSSEVTSVTGGDEIPAEDFESASSGGLEGAPVDESPRWPDEASESAFLAEQGSGGAAGAGGGAAAATGAPRAVFTPKKNGEAGAPAPATEAPVALPPLQNLVDRLPASTREVLDDLFRARFVSVKQIQKDALKS